jgi:hypothetical protein
MSAAEQLPLGEEPGAKWKYLSIRVAPGLKDALAACAQMDGLEPSVWAREVLTAVIDADISLERLAALVRDLEEAKMRVLVPQAGPRKLGLQVVARAACLHPLHLRSEMVTFDLCQCGKEFPR